MSRRRSSIWDPGVGFDPYLVTRATDLGGDLIDLQGNLVRDGLQSGSSGSDGYGVGVYAQAGANGVTGVFPQRGDLMVLTHIVGTTSSTGLAQPPTANGNPWIPMPATGGGVVNHAASGASGAVRVRQWYKWASDLDGELPAFYFLRNTAGPYLCSIHLALISRQAFAVDPAYTDEFGNTHEPAPYIPTATVRTGSGGNPATPAVPLPNLSGRFRNKVLMVGLSANAEAYGASFLRTDADYAAGNVAVPALGGPAESFLPRGAKPIDGRSLSGFVRCWNDVATGGLSRRHADYTLAPNVNRFNDAFVSVTLAPIVPYSYPAASPAKTWDDYRDTFDTGAPLSDRWLLSDATPDMTPDIVDGQLHLPPDGAVVHKNRVNLQGKSLVVGPIDYPATDNGNNLNVTLCTDVYGLRRAYLRMYTVPTANGANIRWEISDEGYVPDPFTAGQDVAIWHPENTKYWRIRESDGIISFEVSGDLLRWTGAQWGHRYLADQLVMRPFIFTTGAGHAYIDNVNPPVQADRRPIPYESSWAFMGAPVALREALHGRDVLVGIADQGTTAAVREAQNVTMTARNYVIGAPPAGREVFEGAVHGCYVTPCGVPAGGRFVEAVISGTDGTSSAAAIMTGILWCARMGAKAINLSFGGGSDEPVFSQVFAYIAATFDTDISIAAGNSYNYGIELPAAYSTVYDNVHSVIAWDEVTNTRPPFSNHHELASGCAPGNYVGGRLPGGDPVLWRGTSAAAPHRAQLAARLQTGRRFTAAQAGTALDRNARDTGQPASEQGGGAFDLARAHSIIGDPTGTSNLPSVAMPRFVHGEWAGVADRLNEMIDAVEHQGITCVVRYGGGWNATIASGIYGVLPFNTCDVDSYGGMWDGSSILTIPRDGLYLVALQVRYATHLNDRTNVTGSTGPYAQGSRGAVILVNGTVLTANAVAVDRRPASTDYDGVTCLAYAAVQLFANDWIFAETWQNSGATIECLQASLGGTWLGVTRLAPLAPTFAGTVAPVTALTGIATRYDQVTLGWQLPASDDVMSYLVRRLPGSTPPAAITSGAYLATVDKTKTTYLDADLEPNATYSYAVWARYPSGYSEPAVKTVTTSARPAAPAPVSTITSTRRTTGVITMAWTTPPNPDGNGIERLGIMVRRADGYTPPATPDGGILVADLPPNATGYEDNTVIANGKAYAYSVFTYRAEQVYSTPATHVRSTAVNTSIMGFYKPNDPLPAGWFHPSRPPNLTRQGGVDYLPGLDEVGAYSDGAGGYITTIIGTFFWVRRPALFKGFRFLRPYPNIGDVRAVLCEFEAEELTPYGYLRSPQVLFGTSVAYRTWEEAILPAGDYVELTPFQIYYTMTQHPYEVTLNNEFFGTVDAANPLKGKTPNYAPLGLSDYSNLLVMPGGYWGPDNSPGWDEALGTYRPAAGNTQGTAVIPPDYQGPIQGVYGLYSPGFGHSYQYFWHDVIVNEL